MSRRISSPVSIASAARVSPGQSELDAELMSEGELDFPMEELREFLSADLFEVPADPTFKEQLRERLWALLQRREQASED